MAFLRFGWVRFQILRIPRQGSVLWYILRCGSCGYKNSSMLRCGSVQFPDVGNPTARFGYIWNPSMRFGAGFLFRKTYGAVRCGFQDAKKLRCGAVRLTAPNRTVKNPDKKTAAVSIGDRHRCLVEELKPLQATGGSTGVHCCCCCCCCSHINSLTKKSVVTQKVLEP